LRSVALVALLGLLLAGCFDYLVVVAFPGFSAVIMVATIGGL